MIKNLTKTQVEIEGLAGRVPSLTERQMNWAKRRFPYDIHILGQRERECICPECKGEVYFPESHDTQKMRCPHCGAYLVGNRHFDSYGWKWSKDGVRYGSGRNHQEEFFSVMNVVGGWQVTRLFYMERWCYVRKGNTPWKFYECCQAWNKPDNGNTYFRSLPKQGLGYHYNCYSLHRWRYECTDPDNDYYNKYIEEDNELEARMPNSANYFESRNLAPYAEILPAFRRCGLTPDAFRKVTTYNAMGLMEGFARRGLETMHETLLKCGAYEVFNRMTEIRYLHDRDNKQAIYTAWKICRRNGYKPKNMTEWFDLVNLLAEYGFDYHSPHYVCPDDLHDMHQRILRLVERKKDEMELKRRAVKNEQYKKRIAKYLDLVFKNDDLTIKVLPDIESFKAEGEHLGHCVYRCKYYEKENSLILSARGKRNKRWETIEVDLRTFTILQCYGYKDKHTERHKEIIDLVMENMWQIKERKLSKKAKVAKKIAA